MSNLGEQLLQTAFFDQHKTAYQRVEEIDSIADMIKNRGLKTAHSFWDMATADDSPVFTSLLLGYNPALYAEEAWGKSQDLSGKVIKQPEAFLDSRKKGLETELALHGLIWYGIAKYKIGRYSRLTIRCEDHSTGFGALNGFDNLYRTDHRRWKLQVKSSGNPEQIQNKYANDIIVLSPEMLLSDRKATAYDLNSAISCQDTETLDLAHNNLIRELRTQKAISGFRRVI